MSADTLPPPPPPVCLHRSYVSRRIKGGTVIAESVLDLEAHRRLLLDPDGYRDLVAPCRACGSKVLHAHCFRDRILRPASREEPVKEETIRLFRCATKSCRAVFTVLPAVMARHLWRLWRTVEDVSEGRKPAPKATTRRWLSRLGASALHLVQALLALATAQIKEALRKLPGIPSRRDLLEWARSSGVVPPTHPLEAVAGWVHRAQPGLRLM